MSIVADLELEFAMTYVVRTSKPLDPTTGSPWGARQYWQVSEATLDGPQIKARLAATGLDWMGVSDDGFWRPDVRAQFRTDDDAIVLMAYTGPVQQSERFAEAAEAASRPSGAISTCDCRSDSRRPRSATRG